MTLPSKLAAITLALAAALPSIAQQPASALTTAQQIRALPPQAANQHQPVRLQGVVTAPSGWQYSFFLQDPTGGISVEMSTPNAQIHEGTHIEAEGATSAGRFAPVVIASSVKILGESPLPKPHPMDGTDFTNGNLDSQWVSLAGTITNASIRESWSRQVLFLDLHIPGGGTISVRVHDYDRQSWEKLVGSSVTVQGVCGTIFNDKRQFIGQRLFVNSLKDVKLIRPAPSDPFNSPIQQVAQLRSFSATNSDSELVHVRGTVTFPQFQDTLYLQDGENGIAIHSTSQIKTTPGDQVDVVGVVGYGNYSPSIEVVQFRILKHAAAQVEPQPATADKMIYQESGFAVSPHDSQLVHLKGTLIDIAPGAEEDIFFLRDQNSVFTARLPRAKAQPKLPAEGSTVDLTGVVVTRTDSFHEAKSFRLLLRSAKDITVLVKAPWWNVTHATHVAEILAVALIIVLIFLLVNRRQASLKHLALTDPRTDLLNRRGFLIMAETQWQLACRKQLNMLLFYIDVNDFKQINDTYGHKTGDTALVQVSKALKETFRKTDPIGRLGGDEFAVVAMDTQPSAREEIEKRLLQNLQKANAADHYRLTLSIGVLLCDSTLSHLNLEDLLSQADQKMYDQKRHHKESKLRTALSS